jgi:hypothetical protein
VNHSFFGEKVQRQDGYTRSLPALLLVVSSDKGGKVKGLHTRRSFRPTGDTMKSCHLASHDESGGITRLSEQTASSCGYGFGETRVATLALLTFIALPA